MSSNLQKWWQNRMHGAGVAAAERARVRLAAHPWPESLLSAVRRLQDGDAQAYLVGGTVRDVLRGREGGGSFDVATSLVPEQVRERFERVAPTGIEHGTVLILDGPVPIECTTFRREGRYSDARRPDQVVFTDDPLADLDRRDLTVNAIAFDPSSGRLLDPHDGARDLERRRLRAVGDPLDRFREDGLRPLRVARFAATLELEPDQDLLTALGRLGDPDSGYSAGGVALERVRDELEKMMVAERPSIGFELLRSAGLLALWLPELDRCRGVPQNRYHAYDVYFHCLYTCDAAPAAKPLVRWAALLHDIGKPDTRVEREGEGTFYNHQFVGATQVERLLERLRFAGDVRDAVVHLVREHMFDYRRTWSDAALRRWLRHVGPEHVADLFDLRIADLLGNGLKQGFPFYLDEMRERIETLIAAAAVLRVTDLAVDGNDVMRELGIAPGPEVRAVLEGLLEEVLDHPERNRRPNLLERLRQRRAVRASQA
ncbi:MAG TPA: CCA tRNA nucleotidyltransferase [Candidatus Limnocylindria bacterium]|nr:CCA tRNA nucleotidyltransferase [Candidatus Limnocylindria bacterium]